MRSSARLFAGLLLVFVLATAPTPATAFLHDPEAADASGAHQRSAAILSANHTLTVVAHARQKNLPHAGFSLIASSVERFAPSLRFEQVCYFAKPPRAVDFRGRVYDATGPPLAKIH
jgi:hypothetical protein